MARKGLNTTLSYVNQGTMHTYRIRTGMISHGVEMISSESAARTQRAYYPHRSAEQRFTLQVLLKDWTERSHFTNWLSTYASYAIDPDIVQSDFPWMTVSLPGRDFTQQGVPLVGYEWGTHTGQMMFTPQVIFEAATSPGQKGQPSVSSVINKWAAFASDPAIQYFYPIGTQLSGNQVPANYAQIQYPGDPSQFNTPNTPAPVLPTPTGAAPPPPIGVVSP